MAEQDTTQKTEEPTQRRVDKAFEEGSVPKSSEVTSWFILASGTVALAFAAGPLVSTLKSGLVDFIARPETFDFDGRAGQALALQLGILVAKAVAIPFGILMAGALAGHLLQHRPTWSSSPLEMSLDKLSLVKGLSRMFGVQGLVNFVKSLLKLGVVGLAAGAVLWPQRALFLSFIDKAPEVILPSAQALVLKALYAILGVLFVIAAGDLVYQRMSHRQNLRMTKQEVRDEHKEMEGDPQIKQKIRQIRMERTKRRMMQAIPRATVVVTNPTHFAVALRYENGETAAPTCVAKGVDELALRIRFAAKEHKIPVVENPPLARALYATVDVDEMIPQEHYKAVAEVIGFVLRLKNRGRRPAPARPQARGARRIT
jgi:flagellar biosynthesis protein FlhB